MGEWHFSWLVILLLCVQLYCFLTLLMSSALFAWRRRTQITPRYLGVKRTLRNCYIGSSVFCILAFCADGGWFWGVGLLVCQLLILHLVRFISYRRVVVALAESRDQDGRYILGGAVAQREEAAARIVNVERECGDRE